jgi:hypothetical protein
MSHAAFCPSRWTLGFALVCGALVSLSAAVHAGVPAVQSPFTSSACLEPSDVTGALADPNAYYAGSPKCGSLCKQAGNDCAQYVKLAASCQRAEIGDDASYAKRECEVENEHGTATTTCKTEIDHGASTSRSGALEDRNNGLDVCDTWEHACEASCPHP